MVFFKILVRVLALTLLATGLHGCGSATPSPENSAWEGLALSLNGTRADATTQVALSPTTWYLKVQATNSPPALLAFGFVEPNTTPPTEVWFSGGNQYIKIRAGRVAGTYGLPGTNWKDVSANPAWPQWAAMAKGAGNFTRTRSTMPGYDQGIQELVEIAAIAKPSEPVSTLIAGASDAKAQNWRWYRERVVASPRSRLPDAIFATAYLNGSAIVAYSQQCLTENYCLKMMRWPQLESEPHPW